MIKEILNDRELYQATIKLTGLYNLGENSLNISWNLKYLKKIFLEGQKSSITKDLIYKFLTSETFLSDRVLIGEKIKVSELVFELLNRDIAENESDISGAKVKIDMICEFYQAYINYEANRLRGVVEETVEGSEQLAEFCQVENKNLIYLRKELNQQIKKRFKETEKDFWTWLSNLNNNQLDSFYSSFYNFNNDYLTDWDLEEYCYHRCSAEGIFHPYINT